MGKHTTNHNPNLKSSTPTSTDRPERSDLRRENHAGVLMRGLAWILDGFIVTVIVFVLLIPSIFVFPALVLNETLSSLFVTTLLLSYYIGTEAAWSRTPGKAVLGLRVIDVDGTQCSRSGAATRNVTKVLGGMSVLPVLVGVALIFSTDKNQRLGDLLGNTTVVHE